jgi:hypothetical protein
MNKKQKIVLVVFIISLLIIFLIPPCNVNYPKINKSFLQFHSIFYVTINTINQIPYENFEDTTIGLIPHIFIPLLYVEILISFLITISLILIFKD